MLRKAVAVNDESQRREGNVTWQPRPSMSHYAAQSAVLYAEDGRDLDGPGGGAAGPAVAVRVLVMFCPPD